MRPLVIAVILVALLLALAWYLLTPGSRSDLTWVVIGVPILLLLTREIYERLPPSGTTNREAGQWAWLLEAEPDDADDDEADTDASPLTGLWAGTAEIWPDLPDGSLRIFPLRVAFAPIGQSERLAARLAQEPHHGITEVDVVEYDEAAEAIDLRIVVRNGSGEEPLPARLRLAQGRLVPEDPTDHVTLHLHRVRWMPIHLAAG